MQEHKRKIIIGNLKMNILSPRDRDLYIRGMRTELGKNKFPDIDIALCPPYIHIESFVKNLGKYAHIGAQNTFWDRRGSYTGEISPVMIKNIGANLVIIGHSERRQILKETGEMCHAKILGALESRLEVVYCVGETQEERFNDQVAEVLNRQVVDGIGGIAGSKLPHITIAYEPLWSVGTDNIPGANEIMQAGLLIKRSIRNIMGPGAEDRVRVVYGGSVSSRNLRMTCFDSGMDGVLIGRASLHPSEFVLIAQKIATEAVI